MQIHRSTRTLIRAFFPVHEWLRINFKPYHVWSMKPYSRVVHWAILFLVICSLPAVFLSSFQSPEKLKATGTYDFPRWEWANPKPTGNNLNKVTTCSDGTVWAVGNVGTILKSTDSGTTWKQEYTGVEVQLNDIYCQSNTNVVVAGTNQILQYNGQSWTSRLSGSVGAFDSINYINNVFIVKGSLSSSPVMYYSADGTSWTIATYDIAPVINSSLGRVIYADSKFEVTGNASGAAIIYYSTNGITWTKGTFDTPPTSNASLMVYANNKFVVATGGFADPIYFYYSIDGITWIKASYDISPPTNSHFNNITYSNNSFVAVGGGDPATPAFIFQSADGISWTKATYDIAPANGSFFNTVTYSNNVFVAVGGGDPATPAFIYHSADGISWTKSTYDIVPTNGATFNAISYLNNKFIAIGGGGSSAPAFIYHSADGISWTKATYDVAPANTSAFNDLTFYDNKFVAVGCGGSYDPVVVYDSVDGDSWTKATNDLISISYFNFTDISFGNGKFVAVGVDVTSYPYIYYSSDGITWIKATDYGGNTLVKFSSFNAVIYANNKFVAIGSTSEIYNSPDGVTWTKVTDFGGNNPSGSFDSIVYGGAKFVVAGSGGKIYNSDNGSTWTKVTDFGGNTPNSLFNKIIYSNNNFIAAGSSGKIYSSSNGVAWVMATYDNAPGINASFKAITYANNQFIATGSGGPIAPAIIYYSINGTAWTKAVYDIPPANSSSFGHVIYANNKFVTTGGSPSSAPAIIYSSTDGATWTKITNYSGNNPVNNSSFGDIIFANNQFMVTGSYSSNPALLYRSSDGLTWTKTPSITINNLSKLMVSPLDNSVLAVGNSSTVLHYTSPANATATKLLIQVSGQNDLEDEDMGGITGTNSMAYSGIPYTVKTYAVDNNNKIDHGIPYQVAFSTTDPADTNPAPIYLENGVPVGALSCDSIDTLRISKPCGIGSTEVTFHTPGIWKTTVMDSGGSGLASSTSSNITVLPGPPHHVTFDISSISAPAGVAKVVTLGLADLYGNPTSDPAGKTVNLSSSSTSARFSASSNGPWTSTLDLIVPAGNPAIAAADNKTVNFYYLDFSPTSSTVTASSAGLNPSSLPATISGGIVTQSDSELSASSSSCKAGNTITVNATVSTTTPDSDIMLYSSRSDDIVTKTSNSNNSASFTFSAKKAGTSILSVKDETDSTWLEKQLTFDCTQDNIPKVDSTASPTIETITTPEEASVPEPSAISKLIDSLQNNPAAKAIANIAEKVTQVTAAIGLIPLIANLIGGIPAALHAVNYGFSLTLEALGIRRKRKSWGRVYDSTTGKGIDTAMIRLYDQADMQLRGTIITDLKGKYYFSADPGVYALSVSKDGFIFPTEIFAKYGIQSFNKNASRDNNQYVGQPINIDSRSNFLNIDVPMDPVKPKISTMLKIKIFGKDLFNYFIVGLPYIVIPTLIAGSFLSIFSTIIRPTNKNIIISVIYVSITAVYILSRYLRSAHAGMVLDKTTKKPISGVMISLFEKEHNNLKETRITDRYGRFSINAPKGHYYLKAQKSGYEFTFAGQKDKDITLKEENYIRENIEGEKGK